MSDWRLDLLAPPSAPDAGRVRETLHEMAIVGDPELVHRGVGTMSFTMPVGARRTTTVKPLATEVRLSYKGRRLWWGIPIDDDWDDQHVTFTCLEVPHYLTGRSVGKPNRRNWLQNHSFETDTAGVKTPSSWTQGPDPLEESRVVWAPAAAILGSKILRLTETRSDRDWLKYGESGTATAETHTARLIARGSRSRSGVGQSIDGTVVEAGDRILLTGQSNPENNGIWVAAAGDWTRATNYNTDAEMRPSRVKVTAGKQYAETGWKLTNTSAITVDTTAIFYTQYAYTRVRPRDSYLRQVEDLDVGDRRGERWTAKAWFRLPSEMDAPPLNNRGLMVELFNADTDKVMKRSVFQITDDAPVGRWLPAEASLRIPQKISDPRIRVYLCCPTGVIEWDAASLTYREALLYGDNDVVTAAKALIAEASNRGHGKSTLRLRATGKKAGRVTGRRYLFDEHPNIFDELNRLGVDWWFDPKARTIRLFGGGRTVDPDIVFEIGKGVGGFRVYRRGSAVATRVITLSAGSGSAREEGSASAAGRFSGMRYEQVVEVKGKLRYLDAAAARIVDRRARLIELPELETDAESTHLIGRLRCGDRYQVTLRAGRMRYRGRPKLDSIVTVSSRNTMRLRFTP